MQYDILDQKSYVGRVTYKFKPEDIWDPQKPWAKEGEFTYLVARSTRSGLGYLTEKAFMKNLKAHLARDNIEVIKVERLVVANVAIESTVLTPADLQ